MPRTITSANSVYMLAVVGLFQAPQRLTGYAADAAFATAAVRNAEVLMGVDGNMSAGFIFAVREQTITLQADSTSCDMFETWDAAQLAAQELFFGSAEIAIPSLGRRWIGLKGVLSSITPMPDARRTLAPRTFIITWESLLPVPL